MRKIERHGVCARLQQLLRGMIAPIDADRPHAGIARHQHVIAAVADHDRLRRRGAGFGHGAQQHLRMRLGRRVVGGLDGGEKGPELFAAEEKIDPAAGFPGGDA
jgi:hypothetical protein